MELVELLQVSDDAVDRFAGFVHHVRFGGWDTSRGLALVSQEGDWETRVG